MWSLLVNMFIKQHSKTPSLLACHVAPVSLVRPHLLSIHSSHPFTHRFPWHVWYSPSLRHSVACRRPCSLGVHTPPQWTAGAYRRCRRNRPGGRCCLAPDAPSHWNGCYGHNEHSGSHTSWRETWDRRRLQVVIEFTCPDVQLFMWDRFIVHKCKTITLNNVWIFIIQWPCTPNRRHIRSGTVLVFPF